MCPFQEVLFHGNMVWIQPVLELARSWSLVELARHAYRHEDMRQRSEELAWFVENAILFLPYLFWSGMVFWYAEPA